MACTVAPLTLPPQCPIILSVGVAPSPSSTYIYCESAGANRTGTCSNTLVETQVNVTTATEVCWWCPGAATSKSASASGMLSSSATLLTVSITPSTATPTDTASVLSPGSYVSKSTTTSTSASVSSQTGGSAPSSSPVPNSSATSIPSVIPIEVGIGIGCALIGALFAALVASFLLRRRRGQKTYPDENIHSNSTGYSDRDLKGAVVTVAPAKGGVITNIDRLLPQPAEDDAIIGGLSKIRDGIKNHVQNYYHTSPVSPEIVDDTRLFELAEATGIPTSAILGLLLNPATRVPTIRLALAQFILSRCVGRADGKPSFLPPEVSFLAGYPFTTSQTALFSKWKTISAVLLQQYSGNLSENDARNESIEQALATIEPILSPFVGANADMTARQRNLEGILSRAAQFAFLMFAQPGSFSFDFTGTGEPGSLIVFPALLQTVNDEAGAIVPPRVLSEKEVVTGLGA